MEKKVRIIERRALLVIFATLFILVSILFVAVFGIDLSIEFSGGSIITYRVSSAENLDSVEAAIRSEFSANDIGIVGITRQGENNLIVRSVPVSPDINRKIREGLGLSEENEKFGEISFETIGKSLGVETIKRTGTSFIAAFALIFVYIAFAFRNLPKPFSSIKFSLAALIALVHDLAVMLGIFALLGLFVSVEIDILFITALLVVLAFSVSDTIVVYDRIRENLIKHKKKNFVEIAANSLRESKRRSIIISGTLLIIFVCMLFIGGDSIRYFVLVLCVGVLTSIYSSLFVAVPLLTIWEESKTTKNKK